MTPEQMVAEFQSYLANHDGYIPGTSGELWTQSKQDKKAASDSTVAKYGEQWIGHHVEDCSGAVVRDTLNQQGGATHDQRILAYSSHYIRRSAGNICHRIGERRPG